MTVETTRRLRRPALISIAVCVLLVIVGAARVFSYSRLTILGPLVRNSPLWFVGYDPTNYFHAQFFKVLATPSVAAMQYFLFRALNRGHGNALGPGAVAAERGLDFRPLGVRLILTSLATLHWAVIEMTKFAYPESFFPWSPTESRGLNFVVLLVGQSLALVGMKYLDFGPIVERAPENRAD